MNVVFICGSLEQGKDGVGDYSRKIASRLSVAGYTTQLIALNDPSVQEVKEEQQQDDKLFLQVLRMPTKMSIKERVKYVSHFIVKIKPDWISLQYVPYAFHAKGLPFTWIKAFKKCAPTAKWHIMMHELWIGSKQTDSLKDKLVGYLQKLTIKYTLNNIHPVNITSSLPYYKVLLKSIGYNASILPVFNNIGTGNSANTVLHQQLIDCIPNLSNYYVGVLFGGLYTDEEVHQNIALLIQLAAKDNKQLLLVHVGRSGAVSHFFNTIKQRYDCECISLGEQEPADIASFFSTANFGVSTYSAAFLNKSGSVAAMLNNKLPVILLRRMEIPTIAIYEYAKHVTEINSLSTFIAQNKEWSNFYGLENATKFYNNLFLKG